MTNCISDFKHADVILVVGSNPTEAHPIAGLALKEAARKGTKIVVVDPRRIGLVDVAHSWLRIKPGTNVAFVNGLMSVILAEGLADTDFIASRTEGFEDLAESLRDFTPEMAEEICGIPADEIRATARLYGSADRGSIVYCMGVAHHNTGVDQVMALADLAMMTGNMGRHGTGLNPLRGQNNVQGACDMACLPIYLPGYQRVEDAEARAKFEEAWACTIPPLPGLTETGMIQEALAGRIKAILFMGENPVVADPDQNMVLEALENLEFSVVIDMFLTETAKLADVVLPASSFAEKEGTFSNTERRVQRVRRAIPPVGESRPDWEIMAGLLQRFGVPGVYSSPSAIFDEMAALAPIFRGMSHQRLDRDGGIQWPCLDLHHPGTPILHTEAFARGRGKFMPVAYIAPPEVPDDRWPMTLITGRELTHYHTGTMSRRSAGLDVISPNAYAEIHPKDAERFGVCDGEMIEVSSRRGSITLAAKILERSQEGVIYLPFHWAEAPANRLTHSVLGPVAKNPGFKMAAVKVRKAPEAASVTR
jgi:formate dehydrogenase (NADP+) alpha subunit